MLCGIHGFKHPISEPSASTGRNRMAFSRVFKTQQPTQVRSNTATFLLMPFRVKAGHLLYTLEPLLPTYHPGDVTPSCCLRAPQAAHRRQSSCASTLPAKACILSIQITEMLRVRLYLVVIITGYGFDSYVNNAYQ